MNAKPDCYVAFMPCGCMVACVYDDQRWPADTARTLVEWTRKGYRFEPAALNEVKDKLGPCKCKPTQLELPT